MREELEVKLRVEDPERVSEAISKIGGQLIASVVEEDTYFAHPCRDLASTDEALRLRSSDGVLELTYKGPRASAEGAKSMPEVTLRLQDAGSALELLDRLGFRRVALVRKRRSYYRVGAAIVTLDDVDGLGTFVELEAADAAIGVQGLREIARDLGIDWKPVEKTYLEMLLSDRK